MESIQTSMWTELTGCRLLLPNIHLNLWVKCKMLFTYWKGLQLELVTGVQYLTFCIFSLSAVFLVLWLALFNHLSLVLTRDLGSLCNWQEEVNTSSKCSPKRLDYSSFESPWLFSLATQSTWMTCMILK